MNATTTRRGLLDRLRSQHRTILRNLERLEDVGRAIDRGENPPAGELDRLYSFFRHFVQVEHESIEESLLFPALAARCPKPQSDALRRLEAEHAWGDALLESLASAPPERTVQLIRTFAPLVRLHLEREEAVVFPLAERLLTARELEILGDECDAVLAAVSPLPYGRFKAGSAERDPWCRDCDWQEETGPTEP